MELIDGEQVETEEWDQGKRRRARIKPESRVSSSFPRLCLGTSDYDISGVVGNSNRTKLSSRLDAPVGTAMEIGEFIFWNSLSIIAEVSVRVDRWRVSCDAFKLHSPKLPLELTLRCRGLPRFYRKPQHAV